LSHTRALLLLLLLQAYWPFHKSACRRNDFADAIEQQEPQFAAWMRQHGKLAVLQVRLCAEPHIDGYVLGSI
jgi:hypothetical protein